MFEHEHSAASSPSGPVRRLKVTRMAPNRGTFVTLRGEPNAGGSALPLRSALPLPL